MEDVSENNTNVLNNNTPETSQLEPSVESTVPQEVEHAAGLFHRSVPEFLNKVDSLSMKELKRLIKLVVQYPFQDPKMYVNIKDMNLLELADQLLEAKSIMFQYGMFLKQKESEKQNASKNTTEAPSQNG